MYPGQGINVYTSMWVPSPNCATSFSKVAAPLRYAHPSAMREDDPTPHVLALQHQPRGFERHTFDRSFRVNRPIYTVWAWLNRTETFTQGQIPPYRVEFIPDRFEVGVLTSHHGPGLNFSGVITTMDAPHYRELQYFYGSYALSLRWIRPTGLEFWLEAHGEETVVKLRVTSWVRAGLSRLWSFGQRLFWPVFGLALRSIPKELSHQSVKASPS